METVVDDLTDRAILIADPTAKKFVLPPLASTFLRHKRPEIVAQTAQRLTDRAYALVLENGYQNFERFPNLEAEWGTIAAALPILVQGGDERLQSACDAVISVFHFPQVVGMNRFS